MLEASKASGTVFLRAKGNSSEPEKGKFSGVATSSTRRTPAPKVDEEDKINSCQRLGKPLASSIIGTPRAKTPKCRLTTRQTASTTPPKRHLHMQHATMP